MFLWLTHDDSILLLVMGEEIVQQWRAGLHARPPIMTTNHIHWHGNERKYTNLDPNQIPATESLQVPVWISSLASEIIIPGSETLKCMDGLDFPAVHP